MLLTVAYDGTEFHGFVRQEGLRTVEDTLLGAVREAARYGLYDLDRLERMILRRVAREYFLLDEGPHEDD